MIANSGGNNKLKAFKGLKESEDIKVLVSEENSRVYEKGDGDKEKHSFENPNKSSFSSSVVYSRERSKPFSRIKDEFRTMHVSDRKGSRGRGSSHKKADKDGEDFIPRRKFQESLRGRCNNGILNVSSNKYNVDIDGKPKSDYGNYIGLPEDSRISKVLRRMSREDDADKFIAFCNQLQEAIVAVDNARYIRRAMNMICDSLLDTLHCGPGAVAKEVAARCLGKLGYVLELDFKRFMEWMFTNYAVERNDDVRRLLLQAILETMNLEREQQRLKDFAPALMNQLHVTLGAVDKVPLVLVAVEVILTLASVYPSSFTTYFTDTVDILVGWHIDITSPPSMICFASQSLQRMSHYWVNDIDFSITMLGHFLEDTEDNAEDLALFAAGADDGDFSKSKVIEEKTLKVTSFIKVFNTVMKALGQHLNPAVSPSVTWSFLSDCLDRMLSVIVKAVTIYFNLELIITGNECTWLLLNLLQNKTCPAHKDLYLLLDLEILLSFKMNNLALSSTLQLIAKVVKELSANLPIELVQRILKPGSLFLELRLSSCSTVHQGIIAIYQSLLSLKNIPLLKEVYRLIMTDLDSACRVMVPNLTPLCQGIEPSERITYTEKNCEAIVLFHLKALTNIANTSNSLIGMWVLQPSILELLAVRLIPQTIGHVSATLLYAQLYLLYSHCAKHSHFITTSSLVVGGAQGRPVVNSLLGLPNSDITQVSPTSGHFSIILTMLSDILLQPMYEESRLLLFSWCCELLGQARSYFPTLATTTQLMGLVSSICDLTAKVMSPSVLLAACANLEQLLIAPYTLGWKRCVLEKIVDLCLLHLQSSHAAVAARYSGLMLQLPWTLVVPHLGQGLVGESSGRYRLVVAHHNLIIHDSNTGEMPAHHFKEYMAFLLQGTRRGEMTWLREVFSCCWSLSQTDPQDFDWLRELALSSTPVLLQWATWEAAQLCVNSKLRTPLGKPLDTFMAFEGAIKLLARQTIGSAPSEPCDEYDVNRVRLLLEMVEQLEKAMYNASDGTAIALLPAAKPVRTFFHTNKSTCAEWLSRNRSALIGVALHVGMASTAVRHGYMLLQDLLDARNTKGSEFENAVLQVGWALLKLKQSEAIQGLYAWCRDIAGVKFPYLKALADQAAGKLEDAVECYTKLLNSDHLDSPSKQIASPSPENSEAICHSAKTLLEDQITECYLELQDWNQLAKWKIQKDNIGNRNGGSSLRFKYLSAKDAEMLLEFERGDYEAACELAEWPKEEGVTKGDKTLPTWDCYNVLGTVRQKLANIAVTSVTRGVIQDSDREVVRECRASAHKYLVEGLRNTPSEVVQGAVLLQFAANAMLSESDVLVDFTIEGSKSQHLNVDSSLLCQILWWGRVLEKLQIAAQASSQLSLDAARLARKEGNLKLSLRQLSQHLSEMLHQDNGHNQTTLVLTKDILTDMEECTQDWALPQARSFTELSKLLYSVGQVPLAVAVGAKTCVRLAACQDLPAKQACARLLLCVAKWLPSLDPSQALPDAVQLLVDSHNPKDSATQLLDIADVNVEGDIAGGLLQLAATRCPSLAKVWTSLAGWAYRWGRKANDQLLTQSDKDAIYTLVPNTVDVDQVFTILTHTKPPVDDDDIEAEHINTSDMIEWQLQKLGKFNDDQLAGLVEMWRKSHARTYSFYQLSSHSYFKFLQLCENPQEDSNAITATLRLLHLVVKHAQELQSALELGLATTPTAPWVCIIPQLFSRLSHPQPYVRRCVTELLCRLAAEKPHLIIFPSVVGSDAGAATIRDMPRTKLFSTSTRDVGEELDMVEEEEEEIDEDEESHDEEDTQYMENCFLALVDILAKKDPAAIKQVQVFVQELRRITLLWDELWLGTLAQHHSDMSRRVHQLEVEVARVDDNPYLSAADKDRLVAEKHRLVLKPILFVLEQLHAISSVPAETPHETWFQDKFGENITEALDKLRNPADPRKPGEAWSALKGLQVKLQQRASKKASYSLHMKDISPVLAEIKDSQIFMPGMKSALTVASIHDHIAVLPTKTKPKKLVLKGSDGKLYTYLFKGLEDLHLDERIMQFLSIANTMLHGSGYQARHYAVIPLGLRSGLISWVEGVTPLFSLYKRWQQRQAAINQNSVMRPSELFYSKLTPLLKDCDVTKPESRKEWPLNVLKQVLMELMQETPTYLLSRELWCDSVNAGGWWQSSRLYSTSLAVMSIIGYIIGLGDRHLDNVLVDLGTGQVVHIDYNVCFEKGKSLRVPEKVPFRLTPNLRAALGVTGVEGIFRLTCEHVLKVMKKGRETVLTLLEAFVYDPLIDWTPGSETGYTGAVYGGGRDVALETKQSRRQLEREVTTAMLAVRLTEMRHDWLENRDKMVVELPDLALAVEKWLAGTSELKKAEDSLQECHQLMALVKEAEAHTQHALYTLPTRYAASRSASDAASKAHAALQTKRDDCTLQLQQYKMALCCFFGPQIAQWVAEIDSRNKPDSYLVFDLIKEFLQNAGQAQMVVQCVQLEKELCDICCQQTQLTRTCLDLLGQYGAIVRQFPMSHMNHHRMTMYHHWASVLLDSPSLDSCNMALAEMKVYLAPPQITQTSIVLSYNLGLQRLIAENRALVKKLVDRPAATNDLTSLVEGEKAVQRVADRSPVPLQCVVTVALCNINKRFLMMESAAKSAMECLVDLTSKKGEWFFDEMCVSVGTCVKLLTLLPSPEADTPLHLALKALQAAHHQYTSLQELNMNFASIILPEAIHTVQHEDPSVLTVIDELVAIIASVQTPLSDLASQLQMHLHFVIMGMESPHKRSHELAQNLAAAVEAMSQRLGVSDPLTSGQMLLMGFNGLFDNLVLGCSSLISTLAALNTPLSWKTVDQLRDAKMLSGPVSDLKSRAILDSIFLVKRLQAMQDIFALCRASGTAFKGEGLPLPYDDDRFNRPIRVFVADYVSSQLLGVFSHTLAITVCFLMQQLGLNVTGEVEQREVGADSRVCLEELCRCAIDQNLRQGVVTSAELSQASVAVSSVEIAWRQAQVAQLLTQEIARAELVTQRLQLQLTAHWWLHEDALDAAQVPLPPPPISRPTFMVDLRKTSAALMSIQPRLAEAREQQNTLVASAEQRLKWASGANPALTEVMSAFDTSVTNNNEQLSLDQQLASLVANLCNSVLHHEALRTRTSEALNNDATFLQLVEDIQQSCLLYRSLNTQLSLVEEGLVKLCPPDSVIDWSWIAKAESIISDTVKMVMKQMEPQRSELFVACEAIKTKALRVRSLVNAHYRTMADVRSLLKSMVKFEAPGISDYLCRYRAYMERLLTLIKTIVGLDELTQDKAQALQQEIAIIQEETPGIYEELLDLSTETETKTGNNKRPPLLRQNSIYLSPKRDPHTGKAVQERNVYAVSVWRRVRWKLEGKDPDPARRYTVQEQVDWAINEATSLDNLALLYEGWTPWV